MAATAMLTPQQVKAAIRGEGELALLDLREEGSFAAQGHLLFAVPAPLSRLELVIDGLVPRRATRIILVDGDGTLLGRGAAVLALAHSIASAAATLAFPLPALTATDWIALAAVPLAATAVAAVAAYATVMRNLARIL